LYYVALGDSYSSGEGDPYVDPFELQAEYGVDSLHELGHLRDVAENELGWLGDTGNDGNKCHRSAHSYAPRVWGKLDALDTNWGVSFRACSGATTQAFWDDFKGEEPQFNAFDSHGPADLITVGMGGNDIGFAEIVRDCVEEGFANRYNASIPDQIIPDQISCREKWEPLIDKRLPSLRAVLRAAYAQLKEPSRIKSGGKIIAVGFPRPFPPNPKGTCSLGTISSVGEEAMRWVNMGVVDRLNTVIQEEAQAAGVFYIKTEDFFLEGDHRHDFCVDDGSERWINRIIPSDVQRSVHPKFQYHEKVAQAVLDCWRRCATRGDTNLDSAPDLPDEAAFPPVNLQVCLDAGLATRVINTSFYDLTRDGSPERIVSADCDGPTSAWPDYVIVYEGQSQQILGGMALTNGFLPGVSLHDLKFAHSPNNHSVLTLYGDANISTSANSARSHTYQQEFRWTGTDWAVGPPEIVPIN